MFKGKYSIEKVNKATDYYPIVLIPVKILDSLNKEFTDSFIAKSLSLKVPTLNTSYSLQEPSKYKTVNKSRIDKRAIPGVILLSMFVIVPISIGIYWLPQDTFAGFGPIVFGLYLIRFVSETIKSNSTKVPFKKSLTKRQLKKELKAYNLIKSDYKSKHLMQYEIYKNNLKRYKEEIIENKDYVIEQYLCNVHTPIISLNENTENFKRGRLEIMFLAYLVEEFGKQIKVDRFVNITRKSYQPDFIFISESTGLCIDIEIDEPYTLSTKDPIHFDNIDEQRNTSFVKNNWCVVRFSEKQISKVPQVCVSFLRELIDIIHLEQNDFEESMYFDEKWSYEEALVMADSNFRLTFNKH